MCRLGFGVQGIGLQGRNAYRATILAHEFDLVGVSRLMHVDDHADSAGHQPQRRKFRGQNDLAVLAKLRVAGWMHVPGKPGLLVTLRWLDDPEASQARIAGIQGCNLAADQSSDRGAGANVRSNSVLGGLSCQPSYFRLRKTEEFGAGAVHGA